MNTGKATYRTPWGVDVQAFYREDTNDWNVHNSSIHEDEYRFAMLPPCGTAIDVGAHIGSESLALRTKGYDVLSVEALPENCELYQRSHELNDFAGRSTLYSMALGKDDMSEVEIWYTPDPHHRFIGQQLLPTSGGSIKVPTISLVNLLSQRPHFDVIKLDIEGGEWDAFRALADGPHQHLLDKVDRITVETDAVPGGPSIVSTALFGELLPNFVDVSTDVYPAQWCAAGGGGVHGYYVHERLAELMTTA